MLYRAMVWAFVMILLWLIAFVEMLLTRGHGRVMQNIFLSSWVVLVVIIIAGTYKSVWAWLKRNAVVLFQLVCWTAVCGCMYYAHTVAIADVERQHQVELENIRHDMFVNQEVSR